MAGLAEEALVVVELDDDGDEETTGDDTAAKVGRRPPCEVWAVAFGTSSTVKDLKLAKQSDCVHCDQTVKHQGKSERVIHHLI
jgi:hypothetical protein